VRGRLTARARLTAVFLGFFVVFGAALTIVNYALLNAQLPRTAATGSSTVTVSADPFLAERLLANLAANAVSHNASGDGSIDISLRRGESGAELIVTNSCRPIDAGQLARIREPFRRAANDRTDSHSGAGLGLSIVDIIARAHGWTLTLSAADPARFTASVLFPAA